MESWDLQPILQNLNRLAIKLHVSREPGCQLGLKEAFINLKALKDLQIEITSTNCSKYILQYIPSLYYCPSLQFLQLDSINASLHIFL
jgi:hypothetical protein